MVAPMTLMSCVQARDHLLVCPVNPLNQHIVLGAGDLAIARQHANVVDSLENDQVTGPRLRDHIMVETSQCIRPPAVC